MFTEFDNYLFREGTHTEIYNKLGAHVNGGGTEFRSGHQMQEV